MSNMRHVILSAFAGIGLGLFAGGKFIGRQYEKHCELIEKQADCFSETSALMRQWVKVYQSGHSLEHYFKKNNYRKIAVYGMNDMGYMILKKLFTLRGQSRWVKSFFRRKCGRLFKLRLKQPDIVLSVFNAFDYSSKVISSAEISNSSKSLASVWLYSSLSGFSLCNLASSS